MSIDKKDEYATLREELLSRFQKIFETVKLGVPGLLILFAYQQTNENVLIRLWLLSLAELLLITVGFVCLNEFRHIYRISTYIALFCECDGMPGWNRMTRSLERLLEAEGLWKDGKEKELRARVLQGSLLFPSRWGEDSTVVQYVLGFALMMAWVSTFISGWNLSIAKTASSIDWPLTIAFFCAVGLFTIVVTLLIAFTKGMREYMDDTEGVWKKLRQEWSHGGMDIFSYNSSQGNASKKPKHS